MNCVKNSASRAVTLAALGRRASCCGVAVLLAVQPAMAQSGGLTADVTSCLVKPRQVIQLGSPVFGVLTNIYVDRAAPIRQGQLLAKLDTTVEETQLALDRYRAANTAPVEAIKADLAWNQRELGRRQQLAGNMFSKANDVDEFSTKVEQDRIGIRKAEADLETARLESIRSEAQLKLKLVRSPVNGVVTDVKLAPGEFIYETTPILTIAEIDPLAIDLVVPAARFHAVKVGMIGEVHLSPPVDASFSARVDAIDPVIDAASDTFRVRLALPNPDNAIPAGIRCTVSLPDAAGE
jgi:membrane fusion protein (multidrug efflux system)